MSYWRFIEKQPWQAPLDKARRYAGHDITLLYSGLHESFTGDFSYLFIDPLEEFEGDDWQQLPPLPATSNGLPLWVGYLGYGMRENAKFTDDSHIVMPTTRLVRYAQLLRFNHTQQTIELFLAPGQSEVPRMPMLPHSRTSVRSITSNFTKQKYLSIVKNTIMQIHAGNFYQANITRKFFGELAEAPNSFYLFCLMADASPAPYSAYIRHRNTVILSSSPECFLSIDDTGIMTTRPIKGSARRSANAAEDEAIQQALRASEKNHAENLMIVDLMRNDLAQVSVPGSVTVVAQSTLYSYRTIHHLISTIRAQKSPTVSAYDAVRACFPAGSMTGAPKIAAMRWCEAQERLERGVYSGAIGWFGGGDMCDLSVVIRTLILDGNRFEFQVGGGIVADSIPADEWRETITKARGILAALGLSEEDLAAL